MEATLAVLAQIAMGVSLAACAGLRAFLPLLVVGAAGRLEWIPLTDSFAWMTSWPALLVFGLAVLIELLGDKFPLVDHFLDAVQSFVKPVAGVVAVAAVVTDLTPLQTTVLALVLGGSVAGMVHLSKAQLRVVSTVSTAGLGNPVLPLAEDGAALAGSVVSIFAPLLALALLVLLIVAAYSVVRRRRTRGQSAP